MYLPVKRRPVKRRSVNKVRIKIKRKNDLKQYGYAVKASLVVRRRAIQQAVRQYGSLSVYRKLNALYVMNKNRAPHTAAVFKRDRNFAHTFLKTMKFGFGFNTLKNSSSLSEYKTSSNVSTRHRIINQALSKFKPSVVYNDLKKILKRNKHKVHVNNKIHKDLEYAHKIQSTRDMIVYFGARRQRKKTVKRKKNVSKRIPKWLHEILSSHVKNNKKRSVPKGRIVKRHTPISDKTYTKKIVSTRKRSAACNRCGLQRRLSSRSLRLRGGGYMNGEEIKKIVSPWKRSTPCGGGCGLQRRRRLSTRLPRLRSCAGGGCYINGRRRICPW